jgi:hypothetical protein
MNLLSLLTMSNHGAPTLIPGNATGAAGLVQPSPEKVRMHPEASALLSSKYPIPQNTSTLFGADQKSVGSIFAGFYNRQSYLKQLSQYHHYWGNTLMTFYQPEDKMGTCVFAGKQTVGNFYCMRLMSY